MRLLVAPGASKHKNRKQKEKTHKTEKTKKQFFTVLLEGALLKEPIQRLKKIESDGRPVAQYPQNQIHSVLCSLENVFDLC
jgi:hypothetical protein